jgi:hypothetical protein
VKYLTLIHSRLTEWLLIWTVILCTTRRSEKCLDIEKCRSNSTPHSTLREHFKTFNHWTFLLCIVLWPEYIVFMPDRVCCFFLMYKGKGIPHGIFLRCSHFCSIERGMLEVSTT